MLATNTAPGPNDILKALTDDLLCPSAPDPAAFTAASRAAMPDIVCPRVIGCRLTQ
jgi:hypothetical protein